MSGMEITTNIGCKNNCIYCPQDKFITIYKKRSNIFSMSFEVFKTCLDKIPLDTDIYFSGFCEPWLNRDCIRMVLYAHESGHPVNVSTALVGMTLSDIDLLEPVPFKRFFVHLPSQEKYEDINVDKDYIAVLDKLSKSKINVSYRFHGKSLNAKVNALLHGVHKERRELTTRGGNIMLEGVTFHEKKTGALFCERLLRLNVLLPNGEVVLCCMDYGMSHVLGNLLTSDYASLFSGKEFAEIQRKIKDRSSDIICRYCCYAYSLNLSEKFYRGISALRGVRHLSDFRRVIGKAIFANRRA